jgi:hypothetical protein
MILVRRGGLVDTEMSDEIIVRAKKDLARRRGMCSEKIVLKQIETVAWPDTSLGYPQAGRVYAQVVTPGYRLVLSDEIADFEYHADSHQKIVYCRSDKK